MKNIKTLILGIICTSILIGCKEEFPYKYTNEIKAVECHGVDKDLLHEALYSFRDDIAAAYNFKNFDPASPMYIQNGYQNFVYKGTTGTADYVKIASPHSRAVFEELKKIDGLFVNDGKYSHLNYENEYVKCVMEKIKNPAIQIAMTNLRDVNSLSPKLLAGVLRSHIREAANDPYLTMYLALDAYYQYFFDVDFSAAEPYE